MRNLHRTLIVLLATAAPLVVGGPASASHNWCHNEPTDVWTGIVGVDTTPDPGFGVCVGDQGIWVVPTLGNVQVRLCDFSGDVTRCSDLVAARYTSVNLLGPCVYDLTVVVDGVQVGPRYVGVC